METKEFKVQIPKGYEIDEENSTFECIKFKPIMKDITYTDICNSLFDAGYYITECGEIVHATNLDDYAKSDVNNATNKSQLERLLALNQLLNITEHYNKLHPKQNNHCLYYILFEKKYGYSVRSQHAANDCLNSVVAFFNRKEDAKEVIDNPNFQEILDTIYKN